MGRQHIIFGGLLKIRWGFFFPLLVLVLLVGLGELIITFSPGYAFSVLLLVLRTSNKTLASAGAGQGVLPVFQSAGAGQGVPPVFQSAGAGQDDAGFVRHSYLGRHMLLYRKSVAGNAERQ